MIKTAVLETLIVTAIGAPVTVAVVLITEVPPILAGMLGVVVGALGEEYLQRRATGRGAEEEV